MRSVNDTAQWEYWIPGWKQILATRDMFSGELGAGIKKQFTGQNSGMSTSELAAASQEILGNSRQEYLADRAHTEMREDTAYQRAVADMRQAGLNPYTVGASGAASSASNVGANSINSKLQILGFMLDLKNLDAKNRKITNDLIGDVLRAVK